MKRKKNPNQRGLFGKIHEDSLWSPKEPPSLAGIDTIALDTETNGLRWFDKSKPIGIALGYKAGNEYRTQYLPWGHKGGNLDEGVVKRWAERELRGKHIINLNTRFDIHMMRVWGVDLEEQGNTVSDVGHSAALLNDWRRTFGLDSIAKEYLGKGKTSVDLEMEHLEEYHAGHVDEYARNDVQLVLELEDTFAPLLSRENLGRVKALEDRVIYAICAMEAQGAPIDMELLERWCNLTEQELEKHLYDIKRETGIQLMPQSSPSMAKLFERCNVPITEFTETGAPSFEDVYLRKIQHPMIKKARRARKLTSLRGKYFLPYQKEAEYFGGFIRYAINQLKSDEGGTVSGRTSSSGYHTHKEPDGVNIQQVMAVGKQIKALGDDDYLVRELFIPAKGKKWFCADARQIEYRLFAHFSKSQKLIDAYKKDPLTDFHNHVLKMVQEVNKEINRDRTKDINFAKIYGAGLKKIALMMGMPLNEAAPFVEAYDNAFPEAAELLQKASKLAERKGYVPTLLGRRTRFPNQQRLHKALNGIIQGSAADIMKQKLVELHEECPYFIMRFTVHDEVDGDIPDESYAKRISEVLDSQSFDTRVPILWESKSGDNWRQCK